MFEILEELKNNYGACILKFECSQIVNSNILYGIKDLAKKIGLLFELKVGGCESANDIFLAQQLKADIITVPMIETPYALKKFIKLNQEILSEEEFHNIIYFVNIETITGLNNIDKILLSDAAKYIDSVVLGRDDMASSLNLDRKDVNSELFLKLTQNMSAKVHNYAKKFLVGGDIRESSIKFLENLGHSNLDRYETKNVVFNFPQNFDGKVVKKGINKALDFEKAWLNYKINNTPTPLLQDKKRLEYLQNL